ncbi:hypothetical protein ACJX0J_042266 [Zea mays]
MYYAIGMPDAMQVTFHTLTRFSCFTLHIIFTSRMKQASSVAFSSGQNKHQFPTFGARATFLTESEFYKLDDIQSKIVRLQAEVSGAIDHGDPAAPVTNHTIYQFGKPEKQINIILIF